MTTTEAVAAPDIPRRGGTDLLYVALVARPAVDWADRTRLARAMTLALHEVGLHAGRAVAGPEGIVVTCTSRAREWDIDILATSLTTWRERLHSTPVAGAQPPTSPAELITALTFDSVDDSAGPQREGRLAALLPTLVFDVVVSGGGNTGDLDAARDKICRALSTGVDDQPPLARPEESAAPETIPEPVATRRWARVPVRSSWVRWYRFLTPPADGSEQLARSLVNVAFGGVHGSLLVDLVRRERGLSYSPQSTLLHRDGRHLLVIDVQTTPGDESSCDAAIRTALETFSAEPLSDSTMLAAASYLRGRTIVDRDHMQGAADERAAVLEGSLPSALDTSRTPAELCASAGTAISRTLHDLYRPTGFHALVMSPNPCNGKWVEL
ncbi:insulinase family protein [Williamsia soli]|uniref:insulinase family protein n=1 Tax=Williamsia soli TaxID=364929 RepID=UPI001A9DB682|nr:insulinase family protein [Williamsia soli]